MVHKIIELVGESPTSWSDAIKNAVTEASTTIRGIKRCWAEEFDVKIEDDKVVKYRVRCKIVFAIER
ncbi:MAG: dodecin family protein [Candidatus Hodarchaeales archaeon]|jgi:flavin-binding protein dodecin